MPATTCLSLTQIQLGALAKLTCGVEGRSGIVLLCGPSGVGKTTVLEHLATDLQAEDPACTVRGVDEWLTSEEFPSVVIADDAHTASEGDLSRLAARCRARRPAAPLVLAGQSRLLTLIARDRRLDQATRLTAALLPGCLDDTASLARRHAGGLEGDEPTIVAIHEIAGGVPAEIVRLLELAAVVTEADRDGRLSPSLIETIHRRLSPRAA
jgi:energy-coupling factor transporter ATP-binding protein EcfA2